MKRVTATNLSKKTNDFQRKNHSLLLLDSKATFTLSVFWIDNHIFSTDVSLEMSRSHSSLQLCLEFCLYERTMGVKPVFLTSNHSDSDQSKIKDGDLHKTARLNTF